MVLAPTNTLIRWLMRDRLPCRYARYDLRVLALGPLIFTDAKRD